MNKTEKISIFAILIGVLLIAIYIAYTDDRPVIQPIEVQEVISIMSADGVFLIDPPDSVYTDSLGMHILITNPKNHFTFSRMPGEKEGKVVDVPQQ